MTTFRRRIFSVVVVSTSSFRIVVITVSLSDSIVTTYYINGFRFLHSPMISSLKILNSLKITRISISVDFAALVLTSFLEMSIS